MSDTDTELLILPIEEGALTKAPVWESHKRGRNWLAIIKLDPASPGGLERHFVTRAHGDYYYMADELVPGQPIEFGADYYTSGGRKNSTRRYYLIVERNEGALFLRPCSTGKEACKAAREWAEQRNPNRKAELVAEREKLLARLNEIEAELIGLGDE